ncbi:MAG: DNA translocase FtsK [Phycisphaerales bacterium]
MGKSARREAPKSSHPIGRAVIALALTACAFFLLASRVSFDPFDPPTHLVWPANEPVRNVCGPVGAWVAYQLVKLIGAASWLVVSAVVLYALLVLGGMRIGYSSLRLVGILMIAVAAAGFQALLMPASGPFPDLAGGVIGTAAASELGLRFGPVGTAMWFIVLGAVGAIVAFDKWVFMAPAWVLGIGGPVARKAGTAAAAGAGAAARMGGGLVSGLTPLIRGREPVAVCATDLDDESFTAARKRRRRARAESEADEDGVITATLVEAEEAPRRRRGRKAEDEADGAGGEEEVGGDAAALLRAEDAASSGTREDGEAGAEDEPDDTPGAPQVFDSEALRDKISKLPIVFGHQTRKVATEDDLRDLQGVADLPGYKFPGLDQLEEPEQNFSEILEEYVREQAMALESALREYRIDGEVTDIESGPVITLYHLRLAPGTKVAAISAISSDIARALKAINIRIVSNMVGRDTVGIEVPNTQKEKVRLKELMSKSELFAKMKLPMFLGKDASGEPLIADLTQMPHMLIAGTTGSGKSVAMNTIIMGFLYTKKPNELKLVLVDPKMVEMSQFKDIPHLMCPVVTEMGKAAAILEWATQKMDERYELLAEAGCRDIAAYNDLPWEELKARFNPKTPEEEARIPRRLPYMVFVIDELADLIITTKEVENSIIRIAQKARAVGIHLILATQRPQANVVTGLIKSNMPCRICFKVASGMDSRIVLDQKGGELLLGQGDMLYLSPRTSKLVRAQGTLVDDLEIRRVVRFMRDVAGPSFERQLLQIRAGGSLSEDEEKVLQSENNSSASLAAAREDPMFPRAVEIVLETKRGSVSLLQRRLAIGYTRASRLIDLMGIAGIISDHKGSVARDVLVTLEQWTAMKAQVEADEAPEKAAADQGKLFQEGAPGADMAEADEAEATALISEVDDEAAAEDVDEFPDAFVREERSP